MKLLYIDDRIDTFLSTYLRDIFCVQYQVEYDEYSFDATCNYTSLLNSTEVSGSNIIVIDSLLFENHNAKDEKFTGEEFRLLMRRLYSYIEVIVVSQNDREGDYQVIEKYKSNRNPTNTSVSFYDDKLRSTLIRAVENIKAYKRIFAMFRESTTFNKVLIDQINDAIFGLNSYQGLTSSDIDNLISIIKKAIQYE